MLRVVLVPYNWMGFPLEHLAEAEKTGAFTAVGFVVEYEGGYDGVE